MKFSDRIGITEPKSTLQTDYIDEPLRNSIWNVLHQRIWSAHNFMYRGNGDTGFIRFFSNDFWANYLIKPVDSIPSGSANQLRYIREYFFSADWYQVYNFLEFVANNRNDDSLIDALNAVLERELAGFRFINRKLVPITDLQEIASIKEALLDGPFSGAQSHLRQAMEHLGRIESPDYRNSVKESISAVESAAQELSGSPSATLGDALNQIEKAGNLHGALKNAFSALYGYTSNEGGIRHAMSTDPNIRVEDAKFFLIACSAFINYLKTKK